MKIFLIVEGDSDKIILEGQSNWFDSLGLEFNIVPTDGKQNMVKTAMKHYKIGILSSANKIIFLPDQNSDKCALITRQKIGINSLKKAVTIVMKLEMEAWILADGQCIQDSIGVSYKPAGQTDKVISPKHKLCNKLRRKLGYLPSTVEMAAILTPYFSIERASLNNTSAKRFKEFIERIPP